MLRCYPLNGDIDETWQSKNGTSLFYTKKFTFFEYARHTLAGSAGFISELMKQINTPHNTRHIDYFRTKYFYIQLLAAYSAAYYYPSFQQLVAISLLENSLSEMIRGRGVGIKAWAFDYKAIESELIEKYNIAFKRYYNGIMVGCNESSEGGFNPDMNEFTKLFMEDANYLMANESGMPITEIERMSVAQTIADIPISVFSELSKKSLGYIA